MNNKKAREDCFAYDSFKCTCKCLKELYCKTERCNFYKSSDDIDWQKLEKATSSYTVK